MSHDQKSTGYFVECNCAFFRENYHLLPIASIYKRFHFFYLLYACHSFVLVSQYTGVTLCLRQIYGVLIKTVDSFLPTFSALPSLQFDEESNLSHEEMFLSDISRWKLKVFSFASRDVFFFFPTALHSLRAVLCSFQGNNSRLNATDRFC